jgi:hypothetical protein
MEALQSSQAGGKIVTEPAHQRGAMWAINKFEMAEVEDWSIGLSGLLRREDLCKFIVSLNTYMFVTSCIYHLIEETTTSMAFISCESRASSAVLYLGR